MSRFIRHERDRRILRLALPALGTLAVEPLYVLVDTAIVGRIGTNELAGLGIASTVLLTVSVVIGFMEYGITPDVAYAHGQGDAHKARVAATDALWLTMLLGLPACAVVGLGRGRSPWHSVVVVPYSRRRRPICESARLDCRS